MNAQQNDEGQASRALGSNDLRASDVGTIAAIVVEVRDTAGVASQREIEALLRERIDKSSAELNDGEIVNLASQIRGGD